MLVGEAGREDSSSVRISQKSVSRSSTMRPRGAVSVSGVMISVPGSIEGEGLAGVAGEQVMVGEDCGPSGA